MIALIGATASGKSALAIELAREFDLEIFSIDSLSVYKYTDVVSAKPSKAELNEITHYGVNLLEPSEFCNVKVFFDLLKRVAHKNLIIVGGSSFYLKSMISGLSNMPKSNNEVKNELSKLDLDRAYTLLMQIDEHYAKTINSHDRYRISKALEIFLLTNKKPSVFFYENPKVPLPFQIDIFEIQTNREMLKYQIASRVENMFESGLVDEINYLKMHFVETQAFKAIGVKEILIYLDNQISLKQAKNLIIKNTNALAKRQITFNKTQFSNKISGDLEFIKQALKNRLNSTKY